jgi:hypothetical protein
MRSETEEERVEATHAQRERVSKDLEEEITKHGGSKKGTDTKNILHQYVNAISQTPMLI